MYKVKNITTWDIFFVDTMGNGTHIAPGEEIDSEYPAKFGYDKKLEIKKQSGPMPPAKAPVQEEHKPKKE